MLVIEAPQSQALAVQQGVATEVHIGVVFVNRHITIGPSGHAAFPICLGHNDVKKGTLARERACHEFYR